MSGLTLTLKNRQAMYLIVNIYLIFNRQQFG